MKLGLSNSVNKRLKVFYYSIGAEEDIWFKRVEVTGHWRKMHNWELLGFFCSPNIFQETNYRE
jgi:hypothetical protein